MVFVGGMVTVSDVVGGAAVGRHHGGGFYEYAADGKLRPVIVRPSLIFTYDKPAKLLPVAAFALGNAIGLPFVDRPVTLDTVAKSLLVGVETPGETGIFGFKEMDHLAARF